MWRTLQVVLACIALLPATAPAQEEKPPTSIFDFGGLYGDDDAPATPPSIRDRKPARKPQPATVDPTPKPTPNPPIAQPKPPTPTPTPPKPTPTPDPVLQPPPPQLAPLPTPDALVRAATALDAQFPPVQGTAAAPHLARAGALMDAAQAAAPGERAMAYVCLTRAIDSAIAARNLSLLNQVLDRVVAAFEVDELSFRAEPLLKIVPVATSVADSHVLATELIPLVEAAVKEDDFVLAEKLMAAAEQSAARATPRDVVTAQQVRALAGEMRMARAAYDPIKPVMDAIAAGKATPKDLSVGGRYTCLVKGNWTRGIAMLAGSDDPKLKPIALQDLAAGTQPHERAAVANAWWALAATETGTAKGLAMQRAAEWYQQAMNDLTGVDRDTAALRAGQAAGTALKLEPGLVAEAFYDARWLYRRRIWVDAQVDHNYTQTLPDPLLDRKCIGVRWTGYLKVPTTGIHRFDLDAGGQDMMHLWIDGQRVQRKIQKPHDVMLTAGLHRIRVVYKSSSDKRFARLSWTAPGVSNNQPIPAQYLVHDIRAGAEYVPEWGSAMLNDELLDRTDTKGGGTWELFDALSPDPLGSMIGLRVTTADFNKEQVIRAVQPIFRTSAGTTQATRFYCGGKENPESQQPKQAIARDGYAVGAITVRVAARVNAFKLHFMRVLPTGMLNPKDQYESEWIGGPGGKDVRLLGGDGRPVAGIVGGASDNIGRIGLVMRGRMASRHDQIISARWGTGNKWDDVTNEVKVMVKNGDTRVIRAAAFKEDPAKGKGKTLEITYGLDGERKTIKIKDGDRLIIPGILSN